MPEERRVRLQCSGLKVTIKEQVAKIGETFWRWREETGCMVVPGTHGSDRRGKEERGEGEEKN